MELKLPMSLHVELSDFFFYIYKFVNFSFFILLLMFRGFSGGSDHKESACNAGDPGSIPGSGRFPQRKKCNPLHYSCLENPTGRGIWWAMGSQRVRHDFIFFLSSINVQPHFTVVREDKLYHFKNLFEFVENCL